MLEGAKQEWKLLKESEPGRRFEDHYDRSRAKNSSPFAKAARIGGGIVIAAAGIFLMPAPGPGWLVFVVGLALLASDLHFVAIGLDRSEVRVRKIGAGARAFWHGAGPAARVAVGAAGLACVAGLGYLAYRLFLADNLGS